MNCPSRYSRPNHSSMSGVDFRLGTLPETMYNASPGYKTPGRPRTGASARLNKSPALSLTQEKIGCSFHKYCEDGHAASSMFFCMLVRICSMQKALSSERRSVSPCGMASSGTSARKRRSISEVNRISRPETV